MSKCNADDHPYCTYRVTAGESVCAGGHPQKVLADDPLDVLGWMYPPQHEPVVLASEPDTASGLSLHFSGYDPRAAGGRQTIRLELRGASLAGFAPSIMQIDVQLQSDLLAPSLQHQHFERTASGQWRPLLISFSSKDKEHGQYPLRVTLKTISGAKRRSWSCTTVIFLPRADATLTEIHQVFLATKQNVKIFADDGAIAKLGAHTQGTMDIEISAKNAAMAQVDFAAPAGKHETVLGSLVWDEDLYEEYLVECLLEPLVEYLVAPQPASLEARELKQLDGSPKLVPFRASKSAALISAAPQGSRRLRLFALDDWVLGRLELLNPAADILLAHRAVGDKTSAALTRRISACHAIIRRSEDGAELTDLSRYGVLLDGKALEKGKPARLATGMQIELCASFKGVASLRVAAVLAHAVILQRIGASQDEELLYLITPEKHSGSLLPAAPDGMPLLFHYQGSFWHTDADTKQETRLSPGMSLGALQAISPGSRYLGAPYGDLQVQGYGLSRTRLGTTAAWQNDDAPAASLQKV
jgi:hypothetical protein